MRPRVIISKHPLQVDRLTVRMLDRVLHTFADGGVGVDAVQYFVVSSFQFAGNYCFDDDLGYVVTDHVCT